MDQTEIDDIAGFLVKTNEVLQRSELVREDKESLLRELKKIIDRIGEAIIESNDYDFNELLSTLEIEARECYSSLKTISANT